MPLPIARRHGGRFALSSRPGSRLGAAAVVMSVSAALVGSTMSPVGAATTTTTGRTTLSGWRLDASDDFSSFNSRRWTARNNQAHSNESGYILSRNVSTNSGTLRIQGKKESAGGRKYTTGWVDSRGKYTLPNYFRVEIRVRVPLEEGMWAAPMWFRPADGSGGEIDLLETYGGDKDKFGEYRAHHTVHNAYGSNHQTNQKMERMPGDPLAYHTYVIEKTRGRIEMFVDGQRKGLWQQGDPDWFNSVFESGKRWNIIMNLQIGGNKGLPDSRTNWAADKTAVRIDYVRTWVRS